MLSTGRELSQCGKGLYFVKENICTLSDALVEQASDNVEIGTLKGFTICEQFLLSHGLSPFLDTTQYHNALLMSRDFFWRILCFAAQILNCRHVHIVKS